MKTGTLMQALADWSGWLGPVAWKSAILLVLLVTVMTLWRRGSAAARHLAWTMTFLCLLCLPLFMQCLPRWHAPGWLAPASLNSLPDSLTLTFRNPTRPETAPSPVMSSNPADAPHQSNASSSIPKAPGAGTDWKLIVVGVWLAGLALGGARLLAVQFRLRRMARRTRADENSQWLDLVADLRRDYRIRRPVKLLVSDTPVTPMTWGFWRPVILLPAESREWNGERLRVVLRHELAHVRRWDCFTQELAHVVCLIYWFNPLAWIAAGRMRAERERACDDFVLNTGARPSEYAGHLVEIAQQFAGASGLGGAVAMARPSGLEQRVTAILDDRRNRKRIAKMTAVLITLTVLGFGLLIGAYAADKSPSEAWSFKNSEAAGQLKQFVAEKEAQAGAAARADGHELPPDFKSLFAAGEKGDWLTISNVFEDLRQSAPQYKGQGSTNASDNSLHGIQWEAAKEIWGAFDGFAHGEDKYAAAFARDIIQSIPPGSVYFGGTDPGRFLVTAMCPSQANADPFFVLTQNALADGTYLDYLRSMYGNRLYIPTSEDSQKCFQDYIKDAQQRYEQHQLKPGEDFKMDKDTRRVQVSGQVAVMQINALLAKIIFDKAPDREFYIEESFPLDWMYPHLEPHGLIMKINRQPLPQLSAETIGADHDYWTRQVAPMIGDWLHDETSVADVARFAEKVYLRQDLGGFKGDPRFVQNDYACKMYSKLRSSVAGIYFWRMKHAADIADKYRLGHEADFAFRQAWALCPYSPETVYRYVNLLLEQNHVADALLVAETASHMPAMQNSKDSQIRALVDQLKQSLSRPSATNATLYTGPTTVTLGPAFQIRLVVDVPSVDAEPMSHVVSNHAGSPPQTETLYVQRTVLLDQTAVKSANVITNTLGMPCIEIVFTDQGRRQFAEITRWNLHQRLAIIVDGQLQEAPVIQSEITGGTTQISGSFSAHEAKNLAAIINRSIIR